MSGFENYRQELAALDHEIVHYASLCGVDVDDRVAIAACLAAPPPARADDKARQSLRGLLILRIKVETEMLEQGMTPSAIGR